MPWQSYVADVGCEVDPQTGNPAYREIIITVPRQSGKTTLTFTWQLDRCLNWGRLQRSVFTAQSGKDARDKWMDELFPLIQGSKLAPLVRQINLANGNEAITFKRTGSKIRLLSTSTSSGHSKTLDQAVMDEIWHDDDDRREQGLRPAMVTRPDAQLIVCSTAGTQASTVLNRKVKAGRLAVGEDTGHGIAYFEWSAPDDWDPDDEASWLEFMPALCPVPPCRCGVGKGWKHTITAEVVRIERASMKPEEFLRAYGNRPTGGVDRLIPLEIWREACNPEAKPAAPWRFGLEVAPDRSSAAIALAGNRAIELIEHRPGTGWVIDRCNELSAKHNAPIAFDEMGPAGVFGSKLTRGEAMNTRQVIDACALIFDAITDGTVTFRSDGAFDQAVAGAVRKPIGDRWIWSRKASTTDVTPLMAATLAHSLPPAGKRAPNFYSLDEEDHG